MKSVSIFVRLTDRDFQMDLKEKGSIVSAADKASSDPANLMPVDSGSNPSFVDQLQ